MSRPRALITGVSGQDGSYLAELLVEKGYDVHGLVRGSPDGRYEHLAGVQGKVTLHQGDLADEAALTSILERTQPEELYNFAAQSLGASSWDQPVRTGELNALAVTKMLEAIRRVSPKTRFCQASSAEMFGRAREVPQTETTPFAPRTPYGVAKVYAHSSLVTYREHLGLFAASAILFNHESPRRGLAFVPRKVAHGVAQIRAGLAEKLLLGNLDARRDWGFAGDYVEAMWRMLRQDAPDDYVIATGETHTVRELVEIAFARAGLDWTKHVELDERFKRPAEVADVVGDPSKAKRMLGWAPKVSFSELVERMVDADVAALQKSTR